MSAIKLNPMMLLFAMLWSYQLEAQQNVADNKYELYRFSEAIELYSQLWDKGNESQQLHAASRLGECYRLINRPDSSALWYGHATTFKQSDPLNYYLFGQSLRKIGDYAKAEEAFRKYEQLVPSDPRGKLFAGYCSRIINEWAKLPTKYEVKVLENINSSGSDFSPVMYKKGIMFASDRAEVGTAENEINDRWTGRSYLKLFSAPMSGSDSLWKGFSAVSAELRFEDELYHNGPAIVTADSTIFLTRTLKEKAPTNQRKIRTLVLKLFELDVKTTADQAFYQPFPYNDNTYSVAHPAFAPSNTRLYFSSDMPGGYGGMDLYYSNRQQQGWGSPVNLGPAVNTPGNELFPTIRDETTLYFSSDYLPGYGGLDLFVTHLQGNSWTTPENLQSPINSSSDDFGILFDPFAGGETGLFSSSRPGGKGFDDIYAFRLKPIKKPVIRQYVRGYVKDRRDMSPIAGSTVFLLDSATMQVQVLTTDQRGMYQAEIHTPCLLVAKATKPMYIEDCMSFGYARQDTSGVFDAPRDLLLDRLEINKVVVLDNIYYDFDKWDIRPDARPDLDWLIRIMNDHPISVELGSHTDSRGSFKYNEKLSQRRAESAVNYIVGKGVESSRVTAKGYGEYQLTNRCSDGVNCTPEEHQANRRTEFKVLGVITQPTQEQEFATSYIAGTVLKMEELPGNFFSSCLSRTTANMPAAQRTETLTAERNTTPRYHTPPASGDCYAVEIMVSNSLIDLNDPLWRGIADKNWYFDGQNYHYLVGCTTNIKQADQQLKRMKALGFSLSKLVKLNADEIVKVE